MRVDSSGALIIPVLLHLHNYRYYVDYEAT